MISAFCSFVGGFAGFVVPLTSFGTEPNDFTASTGLTAGVAAGEDDMGAEASSIEPKVTEEPFFTEPTLFLGILTPSFMGTAWPMAAEGRRECVGAGDSERDDWGGPFAQADLDESCGGIFELVDDLLIRSFYTILVWLVV